MPIFVAGFQHETNTFAATGTDWAAFNKGDFFPSFARGLPMLEIHAISGMPISGFLREAARACHGSNCEPMFYRLYHGVKL